MSEENSVVKNSKNSIVKKTIRVTTIGIIANTLLSIVKFWVGLVGNSQAVVADAIHSLSDSITDGAVIIGVQFWSAPADKTHPYGHQRIEAVITLFIGTMIGFTGIGLLSHTFTSGRSVEHVGKIAIYGPILSIILKEILFWITIKVGKELHSSALISNAWHHRSDAISSIPALIAVIIAIIYPNLWWVDKVGALVIVVFIGKVAYDIIVPAFNELTDSATSQERLDKIGFIVLAIEGVNSFHQLRSRHAGSKLFLDMHVQVDPHITVWAGHNIAKEVKKTLIEKDSNISDVIVHIEPTDEQFQFCFK